MSRKIIIILMLFILVSCALESRYSLPNDEKINAELLGEWYVEGNNVEKLIVEKHGAKTYKLILKNLDRTDELISYSKTIKGYQVMNLQTEFEGDIINVFYGFEINENTLAFYEVNDALRNEEFKSNAELLEYFKKNIHKENFFVNKTELQKK